MSKRERARRMKKDGLHEIKNKYRVHAVNKKRKGLVFTAKKKRRALKACASLSAIFIVILGVFAVGTALMSSVVPNAVPDDFVTVSYELPTDGSAPSDHSALENIGYMNYRFKNQPSWFAEMHGTTSTPVGPQSVNTFKQYSDGVLIMADVTSSSMVKAGRQFCYVGDEVMWREIPKNGSFKADSFDDLLGLSWNSDLTAHMTIPAFKAKNGLPGTEFTVYVINEQTLDHASDVEIVSSGEWDGADYAKKPVYQQTFYLRPGDSENLGAAAHYANQMAFTGGLTGLPQFNYITVTYTFDSSWQVLRAEVKESYTATMGITVGCSSDFKTNYEYQTEKSKSDAYEGYFKDFVGKGIDDDVEKPLDALGCITSSFLTKPVTLGIDLEINGKKTDGVISLDASKLDIGKIMNGDSVDIGAALGCIGLKAKLGEIGLYLEDSSAYLAVGDLKAKLPVNSLLSLIGGDGKTAAASEENEDAPAGEEPLFAMGDLVVNETEAGKTASLACELNLSSVGVGLVMPLDFVFALDENNTASLKSLDLSLSYGGIEAKVGVYETDKTVPALENEESFIDLYPYAETVYRLIAGGKLDLNLNYENADMRLTGEIGLDFTDGFLLAGQLDLNVRSASKKVFFALKEGAAYLDLDGIKLAVPVSDAVELVKGFMADGSAAGNIELKAILDKALSAVFDYDLASLFSLTEEENVLTLGIKGTELLSIFGVDFALGDANLKIDRAGVLSVNALGAELVLKEREREIAFDAAGYIDVAPYAETLVKLFKSETLTVNASYENKNLGGKAFALDGKITIGLSPLKVSGEIALSYGSLAKKVEIVYGEDGYLYLVLDALKVKANAKEAAALFSSVLTENESTAEKADVYAILEKVLSVNFGEILRVFETTEEGNPVLNAVIDGSRLLNLFGVNFELGDVILKVGAGKVGASVSGANITLMSGGTVKELPEEEKAVFADLKPVLEKLPALLDKKALSLNGRIVLTAGDTDVLLAVNRGVLSFADGFSVYLDASLVTTGLELDLLLSADTAGIKVALGKLGVELKYADLNRLGDEVVKLYNQLRKTLNPVSDTELLPEARSIKELFNLLSSLLSKSKDGNGISVDSILSGLSIENSEKENGLLAVKLSGVTLDLLDGGEEGFVGVGLFYQKENFKAEGSLSSAVYGGKMPAMPELAYLGADDLAELLDYLAAAVNTLSESNLNFTLSGQIGGEGEQYPDGVKYNLGGEVRLYSGENTAIHLNLDKKSLWVDADTYLYANVSLDPVSEQDKGIYLKLYLLDCDENGDRDGILDCFVSISLRKKSVASDPLTLYAPVNEIMPILSSAIALLGIDDGIVKDYVLSPWLSNETVAQLKGFGNRILNLVGGLTGGSESEKSKAAFDLSTLVSALKVSDTSFELALDSEAILGTKGEPLKIMLGKEAGENGSRLTAISLQNIGTTSLSVGIGYEDKGRLAPEFKGAFSLNGIGSLLQTLARSVTHPVENGEVISGEEGAHEYELNKNFYIDGSIQLDINAANLLKEKLNIKVVAFSITIDEEGVWGVNVRFEYDALKVLGITAINGNTQVDLTGKDNMVYIKRVQTTDADSKPFAKPLVIYRAMPLSNFVNDLIGQAGFLFNLGSKITDLLGGIDMGGSGGTAEEKDLGATVENFLKSIDYVKSESSESWTITLNGAGLTGGTLGDIVIALGADADGKLRTLKAHTSLSATGISMAIDANLTYRNPCGVMDAGVKDITTDIAALLTDGMSYKLDTLKQNGWEGTTYIEGDFTTVEFILAGAPIYTQNIVISTGAGGDAKGTVYGTLAYPDLTLYNTKGYKAEWVKVYGKDDPLPESRQIFAQYSPLSYELSFVLKDGTVKLDYLYDDDDFELPFRADEKERIAYFTDGEGNEYRTAEDLTRLDGDTVLTAVYEKVPYTVTFVLGDEVREETLYYGDAVNYPASPEKTGYTFTGWDAEVATVTQDLTVTALWTANEYTVTFVSKYAIDGFDWSEDGENLTASFTFVYDSEVLLPRDVRTEENGHSFVLRGFCTTGGATCYFDKLPNVTEDTVFTAQWEELGYDIVFVARDGSVTTLNYRGGDFIESSAIPKIPARDGYTSYWRDESGNRISGGYLVTGEARFTAIDEANDYRVSVISNLPYAGFVAFEGGYKKESVYTYDAQAVVLDPLGDVSGYWFGGYYTEADGQGDKLDRVEGILSDTIVYVYWIDNTVTVNLCSDVAFAGSEFNHKKNAYIKQYTFNDTYDLNDSYLPTVEGYQTLAIWHETANGYERVTNVKDRNGEDLWVLWIKNIKVTVTQLYLNDYMGGSRYNIAGIVEGGQVYGSKSLEIFGENGSEKLTAIIDVVGAQASDGNGNLDWGGTLDLVYGSDGVASFELLNQNCFNYADGWGRPRATYGGAIIIKTFRCANETVTTSSGSFLSIDEYTVAFKDENGNELGRAENIRIDCPFPYVKDGVAYDFDDRVFADELASKHGIAVPQKEGYTGVWAHEEIRGGNDIYPVYTANPYSVTLRGGEEFKDTVGWNYDGIENDYFKTIDMYYGETVELIYRNETIKTFTVGLNGNEFDFAAYLPNGAYYQAFETGMYSFKVYLQSNPDTLLMNSAIAYTLDGVSYSSRTVDFDVDYILPEISIDGYTFLGWWKNENGVWSKITSVPYAGGGNTTTVEALWRTNDGLALSEAQLNKSGSKYVGHVKVEGGYTFIGIPADSVTAHATNTYIVCTAGGGTKTQKAKEEKDFIIGASNDYTSGEFSKTLVQGKYIRIEVTVNYYLGGSEIGKLEKEIHTY